MSEDTYYFLVDLLQYLINGLSQGSIYALVALGYTMVYGIIKLINFAHGEFYMIGAFLGYFASTVLKLPSLLVVLFSMILTAIFAVIIERLIYRPLRKASRVSALITALGTSLFIQYFTQISIGADPRPFPDLAQQKTYVFGEIYLTSTQLIIFASTTILMLSLWFLVKKTKMGKAMRATSFSTEAAELMGIDSNKIISLTFFIGAALAAAAGILVGMYYNSIEPMMGMIPGLKAFIAAVLGGIGSIPGAMLGGILLGVIENLVVGLWNGTYRDAIAFVLLIVILLVKPSGLLGKNIKEKV